MDGTLQFLLFHWLRNINIYFPHFFDLGLRDWQVFLNLTNVFLCGRYMSSILVRIFDLGCGKAESLDITILDMFYF